MRPGIAQQTSTASTSSITSSTKQESTYYQIFGIDQGASRAEIRKAYNKLALRYHPDKNNGVEASPHWGKIKRAFNVLSQDQLRSQYDQQLKSNVNQLIVSFSPGAVDIGSEPLSQALIVRQELNLSQMITKEHANLSGEELIKVLLESENVGVILAFLDNHELVMRLEQEGICLSELAKIHESIALKMLSTPFLCKCIIHYSRLYDLAKSNINIFSAILKSSLIKNKFEIKYIIKLVEHFRKQDIDMEPNVLATDIKEKYIVCKSIIEAFSYGGNPSNISSSLQCLKLSNLDGSELCDFISYVDNQAFTFACLSDIEMLKKLEYWQGWLINEYPECVEIFFPDNMQLLDCLALEAIIKLSKLQRNFCHFILANPKMTDLVSLTTLFDLINEYDNKICNHIANNSLLKKQWEKCKKIIAGIEHKIIHEDNVKDYINILVELQAELGNSRDMFVIFRLLKSFPCVILIRACLEHPTLSKHIARSIDDYRIKNLIKFDPSIIYYMIRSVNFVTFSKLKWNKYIRRSKDICLEALNQPIIMDTLSGKHLVDLIKRFGDDVALRISQCPKLRTKLQSYVQIEEMLCHRAVSTQQTKVVIDDTPPPGEDDYLFGLTLLAIKQTELAQGSLKRAIQVGHEAALVEFKRVVVENEQVVGLAFIVNLHSSPRFMFYDVDEANNYCNKLLEYHKNNPQNYIAIYFLVQYYYFGIGVAQNRAESDRLMQKLKRLPPVTLVNFVMERINNTPSFDNMHMLVEHISTDLVIQHLISLTPVTNPPFEILLILARFYHQIGLINDAFKYYQQIVHYDLEDHLTTNDLNEIGDLAMQVIAAAQLDMKFTNLDDGPINPVKAGVYLKNPQLHQERLDKALPFFIKAAILDNGKNALGKLHIRFLWQEHRRLPNKNIIIEIIKYPQLHAWLDVKNSGEDISDFTLLLHICETYKLFSEIGLHSSLFYLANKADVKMQLKFISLYLSHYSEDIDAGYLQVVKNPDFLKLIRSLLVSNVAQEFLRKLLPVLENGAFQQALLPIFGEIVTCGFHNLNEAQLTALFVLYPDILCAPKLIDLMKQEADHFNGESLLKVANLYSNLSGKVEGQKIDIKKIKENEIYFLLRAIGKNYIPAIDYIIQHKNWEQMLVMLNNSSIHSKIPLNKLNELYGLFLASMLNDKKLIKHIHNILIKNADNGNLELINSIYEAALESEAIAKTVLQDSQLCRELSQEQWASICITYFKNIDDWLPWGQQQLLLKDGDPVVIVGVAQICSYKSDLCYKWIEYALSRKNDWNDQNEYTEVSHIISKWKANNIKQNLNNLMMKAKNAIDKQTKLRLFIFPRKSVKSEFEVIMSIIHFLDTIKKIPPLTFSNNQLTKQIVQFIEWRLSKLPKTKNARTFSQEMRLELEKMNLKQNPAGLVGSFSLFGDRAMTKRDGEVTVRSELSNRNKAAVC